MTYHNQFPHVRLRRNRKSRAIRDLVQEHHISSKDFIYPIFIVEGNNRKETLEALPGQYRYSIDRLNEIIDQCLVLGICAIGLFPSIEDSKYRDDFATESYNPEGLIQRAIMQVKAKYPQLLVCSDVALDPYTTSGHDGIIDQQGYVINDVTNAVLIKQALSHANCGADFVCPSDMMDGRIGLIRNSLEELSFKNTGIIAYSAKYCSNLYAPFRKTVRPGCQPLACDAKANYFLNPANSMEALHEVELDLAEGADIVMVKPGLPYLDVVHQIKQKFNKPTAVYQVSGEYAMFKVAAANDVFNYENMIMELMLCFKRAGADIIWSYSALDVATILKQQSN